MIQTEHGQTGQALRATGGRAAARRSLSVVAVEDAAELSRYVPAWEGLAEAALEPNVFYEPWILLPAVRAFGAAAQLVFVLVVDGDPARLVGFFPFERRRLPLRTLRLWQHRLCYLGLPLVRADAAEECLAVLFQWLATDRRGASLVEFPDTAGEGPFHDLLTEYLHQRGQPTFVSNTFRRALLRPRKGGRPAAEAVLSGARRKSLRSKERRLAAQGPVEYVRLESGAAVATWIEEFLRCEASGWKARAGTALGCQAADQAYFRAILTAAFQRGRLFAHALHCGGRPVALRCTFLAREGAFAFKTAYDEAYARFAPGVLLEAETMFQLHTLADVDWVDSCTAPDNFLLNSLWPDRRLIQTILAPTGRPLGGTVIRTLARLREWKRQLRSLRPFPYRPRDERKALDDERPGPAESPRGPGQPPGVPAERAGR